LIDCSNNFTALVHGHAEPHIVAAAEKAMRAGTCFSLPNRYELEHAQELLKRFPALDQVRYTNSGTEAVMTAIRIARAYTGRERCIMVRDSYHGTADIALTTGDRWVRRGIPEGVLQDVAIVELNDAAGLRDTIERDAGSYAALILDLLPSGAGLVPVQSAFVQTARDLATRYGIVLILDEVISFRLGLHGLSGEYKVNADLITLGKVIGGGFPVGAVVGREPLMRELDPTSPKGLLHGGTFVANPVTMAAGLASVRLLTETAITRLNGLGDDLRSDLSTRLRSSNWEVRGRGSLLRPVPAGGATADKRLQWGLWWAAYDRGILLTQHNDIVLSTPMDKPVVDEVADQVANAVTAVSSRAGTG
jgi:glutamate-1-semialdehyde 2,1-aminomutase